MVLHSRCIECSCYIGGSIYLFSCKLFGNFSVILGPTFPSSSSGHPWHFLVLQHLFSSGVVLVQYIHVNIQREQILKIQNPIFGFLEFSKFSKFSCSFSPIEFVEIFLLILSVKTSFPGDFRAINGELRRSCFCFRRERSFKLGSETEIII